MTDPSTPVHWSAERLPSLQEIRERLQSIFPRGLDYRSWATAERAARSLYVFLYAFAIEGVSENRLRPAMVTTMSDAQAARTQPALRLAWWEGARRPRKPGEPIIGRWYAENTRERSEMRHSARGRSTERSWKTRSRRQQPLLGVLLEEGLFDPRTTLDALTQ